jgi:hypothetical protein
MITQPSIWGMFKDETDNNIWRLVGSGAPTSGTSGTGVPVTGNPFAGKGSTYIDIATGYTYKNTNTAASPTWTLMSIDGITGDVTVAAGVSAIGAGKVLSAMLDSRLVRLATGQISTADIVSVASGKFGHAAGYELVPAPAANIALWPLACIISYKFGVAGFGSGGNTTLNWGSGGAAITGLVSAANFAGAGADKPVVLVPLATAGIALVPNVGLNLVTSAAFTLGTATGVINYKVLYTTQVLNTAA